MENFTLVLLLLFGAFLLLRLLFLPARSLLRLGIYSLSGLLCLWLLNTTSAVTDMVFPVNAVTVTMAGFGGLPGIAIIALLSFLY